MAMVAAHDVRQLGEVALDAIARQEWLDAIGTRLQGAIRAAFRSGGDAGRRVRDALHGTWFGHPLHPALTAVPLGSWTAALVLDAAADGRNRGMARAADIAIGVGLAGAAGAALTGLTDWHHTEGGDRRVGLGHALLNVGAVALYATSLGLRRRGARSSGRGLAALGFMLAMAGGYVGGALVFNRRIGMDRGARPEPWPDFVAVLADADLAEGAVRGVEARGVRVVLVRRRGRVHALGERCAHLGGPLAEGSLDGDAIRCPWHGSLFALDDGRVLEGPSAYPQACFDVRTRDGQIEVRPRTRDGQIEVRPRG